MTDFLKLIATAPPNQIDPEICDKLRLVKKARDLKKILDECAFASRASDFGMRVMDIEWQRMLEEEKSE